MEEAFRESTFRLFERGMVTLADEASDRRRRPTQVVARRDDDLGIILELTAPGSPAPPETRSGEIRRIDEEMDLVDALGHRAIARAIAWNGQRTIYGRAGPETVRTYSAGALEWEFDKSSRRKPAYTVEWLLNLPSRGIWPTSVKLEIVENLVRSLGDDDNVLHMRRRLRSSGFSRSLHVALNGVDIWLLPSADSRDAPRNPGLLVFRGAPDQTFRDQVRQSIAFILGRPLVLLGHAEYATDGDIIRQRSVPGFSANGRMFDLVDLPPYPLHPASENLVSSDHFASAVTALFTAYDQIRFRTLSSSYWFAACAPIQSSAVHFGGVVEQLQRACPLDASDGHQTLLPDETWNSLLKVFETWLAGRELDPELRKILKAKISGVNRAPQNLQLARVMAVLDLEIGAREMDAWRHRNRAAHGALPADMASAIRGNTLLQGLIHRILAALTGCSREYVDYASLDHPIRPIRAAVPEI